MDILESMGLVKLIKFVQTFHHSMELNVPAIPDISKLMGSVFINVELTVTKYPMVNVFA
jgi:hypothetical protein